MAQPGTNLQDRLRRLEGCDERSPGIKITPRESIIQAIIEYIRTTTEIIGKEKDRSSASLSRGESGKSGWLLRTYNVKGKVVMAMDTEPSRWTGIQKE